MSCCVRKRVRPIYRADTGLWHMVWDTSEWKECSCIDSVLLLIWLSSLLLIIKNIFSTFHGFNEKVSHFSILTNNILERKKAVWKDFSALPVLNNTSDLQYYILVKLFYLQALSHQRPLSQTGPDTVVHLYPLRTRVFLPLPPFWRWHTVSS